MQIKLLVVQPAEQPNEYEVTLPVTIGRGNDAEQQEKKPQKRKQPKVGRNEPCPCGSGKKYKKCCGK